MKAVLFIIALVVSIGAFSQEKHLSILNSTTGKEKVFKQNQRVRIKTVQGGKIKGNLLIVDENQIMVKNIMIPIASIERIKPNPIVMNVLVSGTLFIIGGYGILGGLVVLAWTGSGIGYVALLTGATSITGGVLSPNVLKATTVNSTTKISVATAMQ